MADDVVSPQTEEEVAQELAIRDLGDIHALRSYQPFTRYFLRRLTEKIEPLEKAILDDDLDPAELAKRRMQRKIYREIFNLLKDDEAGNRGILKMD